MADIVNERSFHRGIYGLLRILAFPEKAKKRKESKQRSYLKHREAFLKYKKSWFQKNRARMRELTKKYYVENRKEICDKVRSYRQANKEKCAVRNRKWVLSNKGRSLSIKRKYKVSKRGATIGDLTAIAKVYERAAHLRKWFDVAVDHIVPISKGGAHEVSNLQIIYGFENNRKHNNVNYKPKVVFA